MGRSYAGVQRVRADYNASMPQDWRWLHFAILAAVCAASINVFGKLGMKDVDSDVATAVRSVVQAIFVGAFVAVIGSWSKIEQLTSRPMAVSMVICSGIAGGLSWIFAFRAIKLADVSLVAPIDKLSMPLGILLAVVLLGERPTLINWAGILLIAGGAYLATWPRAKVVPAAVKTSSVAPVVPGSSAETPAGGARAGPPAAS
jgi:transporter family protein